MHHLCCDTPFQSSAAKLPAAVYRISDPSMASVNSVLNSRDTNLQSKPAPSPDDAAKATEGSHAASQMLRAKLQGGQPYAGRELRMRGS